MDTAGFEQWYRAHHGRIATVLAAATGDVHVARDAADEACARVLERWPRVQQMDSPAAWAYRVGLNVARRRLRRASLERTVWRRQPAVQSVPPPSEPSEVWDAVAELPQRQRTALVLRYVADLTEPVIAEVMGIAPGTVSATLHAARRRLAQRLGAPATRSGHE